MDPAELRRKNFIPTDAFPYQTPVALQYDSGNYPPIIDEAIKIADYKGFEARRAEAKSRGKLRGIGFSSYIEACGLAPSQRRSAQLGARRRPVGVGADQVQPDRQRPGLDRLAQPRPGPRDDLRPARRRQARRADRERSRSCTATPRRMPFGMGTYGSRSLAVGGSAIVKAADKIIAKGKKIAAHLMEADDADVVFEQRHLQGRRHRQERAARRRRCSRPTCRTTTRSTSSSPGMDENAFYDPTNFVYPGRHADLRGRGRPRHRRGRGRQLHRGRRLRQHHQSDDRRGPGAWRHRAGRRPGAARERRLRQGDGPAR